MFPAWLAAVLLTVHGIQVHHYIPDASYDAHNFNVTLIGEPTMIECSTPPCFNPSLVELPASLAISLAPNARYLAAWRYNIAESLCRNLASPRRQGRRRLGMRTFMALLDEHFETVAPIVTTNGLFMDLHMVDVRLESHGSTLLVHGMSYHHGSMFWTLNQLTLGADEKGMVHCNLSSLTHPDVHQSTLRNYGKNLGVLWSGDPDVPFRIMHWLKSPNHAGVYRGLPPLATASEISKLPPLYLDGYPAHNNISPIDLAPEHPGLYLGVMHTHWDTVLPAHVRKRNATNHGNTYMSYFFVMRDIEPNEIIAISAPFCFPSRFQSSRCDIIQFITSIERLASDPGVLLVSYGINDCESAIVKLQLSHVLQFALTGARKW